MAGELTRWRNKIPMKEKINEYIIPDSVIGVFDLETTGLKEDSKIIQFSAIRYLVDPIFGLKKIDDLDVYINPGEPLSKKIIELTGITDRILAVAKTEECWAEKIFTYLDSCNVICGYNVDFDIKMLQGMAKRTEHSFHTKAILDVCEMARDWIPKSEVENHNLQTIVEYVFSSTETYFQFHSSFDDAKATAMLLYEFADQYRRYEDEQRHKDYAHLERASLFINPRKKSEQRIKLKLNVGNFGDIFWDIVKQEWGCCSNTRAKQYFKSINLTNLEQQFLEKYGYRFGQNSPKEVATTWMRFAKSVKENENL